MTTHPDKGFMKSTGVPVALRPARRRRKGTPDATRSTRPRLGSVLLDLGLVRPGDLATALIRQQWQEAHLGRTLMAMGVLTEADLLRALSVQFGLGQVDLARPPSEPRLIQRLPADLALRYSAVPWQHMGGLTVIATNRPDQIEALRAELPSDIGPVLFALAPETAILDAISTANAATLARRAEAMVPNAMSCRTVPHSPAFALLALAVVLLATWTAIAPLTVIRLLTVTAIVAMVMNLTFKLAAVVATRRYRAHEFNSSRPTNRPRRLPCISILIPMHDEPDIATRLVARMARLDYPKELLDICLVVEADDHRTISALSRAQVPSWFRLIVVPDGQPKTKPRAMNYALSFTRGSIIGIYDAEDAPTSDQLHRVAARFAMVPDDVACLQGQLDYYNQNANWLSRCFTIEYANWFRLMLPGMQHMGLVVPLGGTTLFFRKSVLLELGGWDAHNVTEDADLGVRLARAGYRTEVIDVTTFEEANAAPLPWIKQRSRWMKGYILTWMVHSRDPAQLWRDLGPKRFFGFHMLFLGSILNALLAPFLWLLGLLMLGLPHPIEAWMPDGAPAAGVALFAAASALTFSLLWLGCGAKHHRSLRWSLPLLLLYFPLASLAVIRAAIEVVAQPFYWAKTQHGQFGGTTTTEDAHMHTGRPGDGLYSSGPRALKPIPLRQLTDLPPPPPR